MNPFAQGDDQQALADNLRRLLDDLNAFDRRRARLSGASPDRMALWPVLAEQGVIAAAFDEAHGGFAGDPRTVAVIMSELGVALAVEPFLVSAVMAGRILRHCTDSKAAQSLIDRLIAGDAVIALAHRTAPDAFADPQVRLTGTGASARLEGSLHAVPHADVAQSFFVPASNADGQVDIWHVPRSTPGLSIDTYRALDASGAGDLRFESASVDTGIKLALDADGRQVLDEALQWGILGLAAETTGIVQALNARTFEYLMTRKQFGTVIGSFQALQHRAADMWIVTEELLATMELAIEELSVDTGSSQAAVISAAKFAADRAGRRVGNEAVQMHGGMGVSDELIVSHYFRRLAALRACLGSEDSHKLRFRKLA
jgi:alkylation response protein AidB-like acyl-CoA dehydrogenase